MEKEFAENEDGVHAMWGEFSICGDAFDIDAVSDEVGALKRTTKKTVTCPRCIEIIKYCKSLRTRSISK